MEKERLVYRSKAQNFLQKLFSIATYGCESWAPTKMTTKGLRSLNCGATRLLRVFWKDKRTNNWVLEKIGSPPILSDTVRKRKLSYFGYIIRREESIEKTIFQGTMEGCRGRGRPVTVWLDYIKNWVGGGKSVASNKAKNIEGWRTLLKTTAVSVGTIWPHRERCWWNLWETYCVNLIFYWKCSSFNNVK